jgi:nucleoid DNA-binding protein
MAKAKAQAKKSGKGGAKKMTKSALVTAIAEHLHNDVSKTQVKAVLEALVEIGQKELKKHEVFVLPGFAKFVVAKKAGRPEGMYKNPFTKQEEFREAKPASKTVRARPIKALKDAVS